MIKTISVTMLNSDYTRLFSRWYQNSAGLSQENSSELDSLTKLACKDFEESHSQEVINKIFEGFNIQGDLEKQWISSISNNSDFKDLFFLFESRNMTKESVIFDTNKLFKGELPENEYTSGQFYWYLFQSILQSKKEQGDPISPEVQEQLDGLILTAFSKVANMDDRSIEEGVQASPFFHTEHHYHRDGDNPLAETIEKLFTEYYGVKATMISNFTISEALSRKNPSGNITVVSYDDYRQKVISCAKKLKKGVISGYVTFDVTNLVKEAALGVSEKNRIQLVNEKLNSINQELLSMYADNVHLSKTIGLIAPIAYSNYEGQPVLLMLPKSSMSSFSTDLDTYVKHLGFRPSPDQIREAYIKVTKGIFGEDNTLEKILKEAKLSTTTLNTKGTRLPENIYSDINEFLSSNIFKNFVKLSEEKSAPPYLKIIPRVIASLLEGFKDHHIDKTFKEKNVNDLLQAAYFVLSNAMADTILHKDDFGAFNNNVELMYQMIQSILAISRPYDDKAFEQAVVKKLTSGIDPVIPKELEVPLVHLKPAAMGAFSSILGSVEKQKGSNSVNVMDLEGSYYEFSIGMSAAKNYNTTPIDQKDYKELGSKAFDLERFDSKKLPIDLFLCEFRHNIGRTDTAFERENATEYIKLLFEKGLAAPQMTVAIDNTIDLEMSDDLRKLLKDPKIQELIASGRLNIVTFRSAQKFDMLGMDNYYGGVTTTINNSSKFTAFNERMNLPEDQLRGLSYQGLTHLQTYAGTSLDDYRKSIFDNTKKLYDKILEDYPQFIATPTNRRTVSVRQSNDPEMPFIQFKIHEYFEEYISKAFEIYTKKENLLYTQRDSYGFMNMNSSSLYWPDFYLRLSPGLESEEDITKYAAFFRKVFDLVESTDRTDSEKLINKMHNYFREDNSPLEENLGN